MLKFKFHIRFLPTKKLILFKTSKYPFSYVNWKQIPLNFFNFNWKFTHCVTPSLRWRQSHSDLKFKIQFGNWPFLNKYICSEYVESMLLWFISKSWKLLFRYLNHHKWVEFEKCLKIHEIIKCNFLFIIDKSVIFLQLPNT